MGNVHNTQPPVSEADIPVYEQSFTVRSPVMQYVAHPDERLSRDLFAGMWGKCYAVDTAHIGTRKAE
jgi:hypothetical protein